MLPANSCTRTKNTKLSDISVDENCKLEQDVDYEKSPQASTAVESQIFREERELVLYFLKLYVHGTFSVSTTASVKKKEMRSS